MSRTPQELRATRREEAGSSGVSLPAYSGQRAIPIAALAAGFSQGER